MLSSREGIAGRWGVEDTEHMMRLLRALGLEDTVEHRQQVAQWLVEQRVIRAADIGGLKEVSQMLGRSPQVVCNWIWRGIGTPEPVTKIAATKIFDLSAWALWAEEHAHLVHQHGKGS